MLTLSSAIDAPARSPRTADPDRYLPAAPFAAWLQRQTLLAGGYMEVAKVIGVDESRVRRLVSGEQRYVGLDTVDRAFIAFGQPHALAILYPQEIADVTDRWCCWCATTVIVTADEVCPWCDHQTLHARPPMREKRPMREKQWDPLAYYRRVRAAAVA